MSYTTKRPMCLLPCSFTAAIVLCDATWADPDEDSGNGIDVRAQLDFLRLDSMIMMVQINIRQILQVRALRPLLKILPSNLV